MLGAKETDNIHYLSQSGIKVDLETSLEMIIEIVKERNIKLVILDSLIRVHEQDENDAVRTHDARANEPKRKMGRQL